MASKFRHPSTILICGPTQCGKTFLTSKIIEDKLIDPSPENIIWAFSEWQPSYLNLATRVPNMEFVRGIEEVSKLDLSPQKRNLIVLDDLMMEAGQNNVTSDLFTRGSHHRNLTVLYLAQNLFHKGRTHRDCSLNSHYIVLFDNPRDRNQISVLGRQMYPDSDGGKFLRAALHDACKLQPHGYIVVDLHTDTPDDLRVKTCILPGQETLVYKPQGKIPPSTRQSKKQQQQQT